MGEPYVMRLRKGLPQIDWLLVYDFNGAVHAIQGKGLTPHAAIGRLFLRGDWPFGAKLTSAVPIGHAPYWWDDSSLIP